MEKKMESTKILGGSVGVIGYIYIYGLYGDIMEKKMETTRI